MVRKKNTFGQVINVWKQTWTEQCTCWIRCDNDDSTASDFVKDIKEWDYVHHITDSDFEDSAKKDNTIFLTDWIKDNQLIYEPLKLQCSVST